MTPPAPSAAARGDGQADVAAVGHVSDRTVAVRRFAVVGNPVAHSLSPAIHAAFARETGRAVAYRTLLAPLNRFVESVRRFVADGGDGLNVTVPFKREAHGLCGARLTDRARRAGAVNCIAVDADGLRGDNTDGAGLVADLGRLGGAIAGSRVLLIGAGGAARGVVGPLLDARPASLVVASRDVSKADALVDDFVRHFVGGIGGDIVDDATIPLSTSTFADCARGGFAIVVNATSAGLAGDRLALPASTFAGARLAYDMMYGAVPTPFLVDAAAAGVPLVADGLGMLVEQAAESFVLWHGVRPATAPVLERLRESLAAAR